MKKLILVLVIVLLISCNSQNELNNNKRTTDVKYHPLTEMIDLDSFAQILYVSPEEIKGARDGSKQRPYNSLGAALSELDNLSESNQVAVLVAAGSYSDEIIELKEYVHLFGGFNADDWSRDISKYETTLLGNGEQRILVAANNSTIDGFTISGARFRGKGAAIFCDGTSPLISNNTFTDNKSLKPLNWKPKYWHETANDGGALYGTNGASPVIKNNIFRRNKTENGRGAAIAFDGNCEPQITNNFFYENTAGLDDPMRSSDGGAVSLFRWCGGTVENNLFLSNYAGSSNDAGAVFIALWSSTIVKNNIFVDNECGDDAGALFVGGQEHRYDSPLDPFPPKDEFFVSIKNNIFIGNRNPSMNSGAMRFTMESRGEFKNNIVAQNNGVYFQRSETDITDNIILDNMLVIETKGYLDKTTIKNNVIWADFHLSETVAEIENNYMLDSEVSMQNENEFPGLVDDGFKTGVYSAYYLRAEGYSELIIDMPDHFSDESMIDRIVNNGDSWGVVRSYNNNVLQVWGDFSAETSLNILPTYTLRN